MFRDRRLLAADADDRRAHPAARRPSEAGASGDRSARIDRRRFLRLALGTGSAIAVAGLRPWRALVEVTDRPLAPVSVPCSSIARAPGIVGGVPASARGGRTPCRRSSTRDRRRPSPDADASGGRRAARAGRGPGAPRLRRGAHRQLRGWIVSRTEARLCALAAVTGPGAGGRSCVRPAGADGPSTRQSRPSRCSGGARLGSTATECRTGACPRGPRRAGPATGRAPPAPERARGRARGARGGRVRSPPRSGAGPWFSRSATTPPAAPCGIEAGPAREPAAAGSLAGRPARARGRPAGRPTAPASRASPPRFPDGFCLPVCSIYMGLYQAAAQRRRSPVPGLGLRRPARPRSRWLAGLWHRLRGRLVLFDRYTYDARLPPAGPISPHAGFGAGSSRTPARGPIWCSSSTPRRSCCTARRRARPGAAGAPPGGPARPARIDPPRRWWSTPDRPGGRRPRGDRRDLAAYAQLALTAGARRGSVVEDRERAMNVLLHPPGGAGRSANVRMSRPTLASQYASASASRVAGSAGVPVAAQ